MANTVKLPAGGRGGAAPRWPGPGRLDAAGRRLWRDLWKTPQAVMWERNNHLRVVARYVAALTCAEGQLAAGEPVVALLGEVRQLEDRLGLSPMALLRLRWEVAVDEVAPRRAGGSARTRLRAVDDGAVARAE